MDSIYLTVFDESSASIIDQNVQRNVSLFEIVHESLYRCEGREIQLQKHGWLRLS